ncbi:hypothetical protein MRY87_09460 [bacterium]|nr:hypothetical protein [bacterium]
MSTQPTGRESALEQKTKRIILTLETIGALTAVSGLLVEGNLRFPLFTLGVLMFVMGSLAELCQAALHGRLFLWVRGLRLSREKDRSLFWVAWLQLLTLYACTVILLVNGFVLGPAEMEALHLDVGIALREGLLCGCIALLCSSYISLKTGTTIIIGNGRDFQIDRHQQPKLFLFGVLMELLPGAYLGTLVILNIFGIKF